MEREFIIPNRLGLHARAAAQLVQLMGRFESSCSITKDELTVNGKSIMGVLTLAAAKGSKILVRMEGDDAEQAMAALEDLINRHFGET
jgi:phosphocarrier protein HPr